AIGESIDNETLGGATTHTSISGVCDYKAKDDEDCLQTIRDLMDKIGAAEQAGFDRIASNPTKEDEKEIYGMFPADRSKQYNMREIISRLVDDSKFTEYKKDYGKTIICGYARIDGWSIG